MSGNFQIEIHPDAEVLNAFAEQALAPEERAGVLAHLGGCSRCREIVFLAAEAEFEKEAAAPAPAAALPAEPRGWFTRWWLAWIPACAVTAVVLAAVAVHLHRAGEGTEMARVMAPAAAPVEAPMAMPQAQGSKTVAAPRAAAVPHTGAVQAEVRLLEDKSEEKSGKGFAAQIAEMPNKSVPLAGGTAFRTLEIEKDTKASQPAPEYAVAAVAGERVESSKAVALAQLENLQGTGTLRAAKNDKLFEPGRGMNLRVASVEPAANAPGAVAQAEYLPLRKKAVRTLALSLPNGVAAASIVEAAPRMLALDATGRLFLSLDSGLHWQAVALQWKGKAATVRVHGAVAAGKEESIQGAVTGPTGAGQSAAQTFELVNDQGQLWVSTDGLTWTAE